MGPYTFVVSRACAYGVVYVLFLVIQPFFNMQSAFCHALHTAGMGGKRILSITWFAMLNKL